MSGMVRKLWCCGAKSFATETERRHIADEVGEGRIRVYVGKEIQCKMEMEVNFLNHPLFEDLLRLYSEEFGHSYDGALRIACDTHLFLYLLQLLKTSNPSAHYMHLSDLISHFHANHHSSPSKLSQLP